MSRKPRRKRQTLRTGRYEQILNNVTEEWHDLGQFDFATPQELCMTIKKLIDENQVARIKILNRDSLWKNRLLNLIVP